MLKEFSVINGITDTISSLSKLFGSDKGTSREQAIAASGKKDLDLVEKYGGFLSGAASAYRKATGQEEGVTPFEVSDLEAPRISLGSDRAPSAPAMPGIQDRRLQLAFQTAMRRASQNNPDFQRLISQNVPSPQQVRGRRTLGVEPARLPQATKISPASVRKEEND